MQQEIKKNGFKLKKTERLSSRKDIALLFISPKEQSKLFFPIKMVWAIKVITTEVVNPTQVLISVSKRYHKKANKRNAIKRRIKEAYRLNKSLLTYEQQGRHLLIGFIYCSSTIEEYALLNEKMQLCLQHLTQVLTKQIHETV